MRSLHRSLQADVGSASASARHSTHHTARNAANPQHRVQVSRPSAANSRFTPPMIIGAYADTKLNNAS
ncbi:hypothetical protein PSPO01_03972 [Paraphaeosphaeria sporulosa]